MDCLKICGADLKDLLLAGQESPVLYIERDEDGRARGLDVWAEAYVECKKDILLGQEELRDALGSFGADPTDADLDWLAACFNQEPSMQEIQ